jgi:hypothetical protein
MGQTNDHVQGHEDAKQQDKPSDALMRCVRCVERRRRRLLGLRHGSTAQPQQGGERKTNDKAGRAGIICDPAQLPLEYAKDNGRDTGQQAEKYPDCRIVLLGDNDSGMLDASGEESQQQSLTTQQTTPPSCKTYLVFVRPPPVQRPQEIIPQRNGIQGKGRNDVQRGEAHHVPRNGLVQERAAARWIDMMLPHQVGRLFNILSKR